VRKVAPAEGDTKGIRWDWRTVESEDLYIFHIEHHLSTVGVTPPPYDTTVTSLLSPEGKNKKSL